MPGRLPAVALLAAVAAGVNRARLRHRRRQERSVVSFRDHVVLITGGSRGLGLALAERFALEGAHLVLLARSRDQLERAAEHVRQHGAASVRVHACDVRDSAAVDRAVADTLVARGRVDVLVNNAGVIQVTPVEHAHEDDFRTSIDTHFWAALHLVRACLPHFVSQGRGRIINIASVGGRVAVPHLVPYCVGKFALVGFSEGLRAELRSRGVVVTTVSPFLMRTGSHRNVLVRGQHRKEAIMFGLGSTRLVAFSATRAAARIVEAARRGLAHVDPGWPSRAAAVVNAVAPEWVADVASLASRWVLPGPTDPARGDRALRSRDLNLGVLARAFATDAVRRFNQVQAVDERSPTPAR